MRIIVDDDFAKSFKLQFHKATADWETRAEESQAGDFCYKLQQRRKTLHLFVKKDLK